MKIYQAFQEIKKKIPLIKDSDREFILKSLLKTNKTQLYLSFDKKFNQTKQKQLFSMLQRYQSGEPLGYILGEIDFLGMNFFIKKPVLIPRIDSEVLVEKCLNLIKKYNLKTALEIGSGSGNLSLSLATRTKINITAIDLSTSAIFVAKKNLKIHKEKLDKMGSKVIFRKADVFSELAPKNTYEMIFSNPPYVSCAEIEKLPSEIKDWEDKQALWGDKDGLKFYRYFSQELQKWLIPNGWLALEHGYQQKEKIIILFKKHGWNLYSSFQDLGKRDRGCIFRSPQAV